MPEWTDEQKSAIEAYGRPVIVSAAAGSGKTAVLVERTVRLLCDEKADVPADTLLAVTFTNDAASQMLSKLSRELENRASSEPENQWIQRQQVLLRLADITTINAFCFGLVKDNLSETDFQSGIRILEENEADMLNDRALTEVFEREYRENPAGMEELISVFCKENDAALRKMTVRLYKFLRTIPFSETWAKKLLSWLRSEDSIKDIKSDIEKQVFELCGSIEVCIDKLSDLAEALEYHSASKSAILTNCETARKALADIKNMPYERIPEIYSGISWKSLGKQKKSEAECSSEIENAIYSSAKDLGSRLREMFKELAQISCPDEAQIRSDAEITARYFERLYDLTSKLDGEVYKMKTERNAVDFADTELMSIKLLVRVDENGELVRTPLCEEIVRSKRYRVILIDEFQDVNNLQEVIFKAVSDTENLKEIGKNVFVVGDVKQAIYRFRQANPMIFMNTRLQGKDPESPVCELLLRRNFRSRKSVLDFCNYIFGSLMSKGMGETEYNDEEMLYQGSEFPGADSPTEIVLIDDDCEDETSDIEFTAAARKIRSMIDSGVQVRDGSRSRACRPSDFCVLTRTNVSGSKVTDIFSREGLKVLVSETSGYLKSREISLLLNLLAVITNPMQNIPLASVMLSPIMGFTDDEISKIRIINKEEKLYKTVLKISLGECETDPVIKKKCEDAVKLIKRMTVYASGLTLTRLIRKIYDMTDIFSLASAYEDAEQKCANLYLLLEYAKSYEQTSQDGPAGFLRYIGYISKSGGDFEQALTVTESQDAVILKTIHRSKGLEYPFIVLCQTKKQFNRKDLSSSMLLSQETGSGFRFYDYGILSKRPTVFWDYVRKRNSSELLSEELRLLYVALTRAQEKLIIILDMSEGSIKRAEELSLGINSPKIPSELSSRANCQADWLMMALVKHPGFSALRSKLNFKYEDPGPLPDVIFSAPPVSTYKAPEPEKDASVNPDPELVKKLKEVFSRRIDDRLTKSEAKLTVSEIVRDNSLSFFPEVPTLDESLEEFGAARRGTITHKFMQYCNFKKASEDIEKEISALVGKGIFTPHESEAIDRRSVRRFFESEIYSRLKNSAEVLREQRFIVRFDDIDPGDELKERYSGTDGMLQGIADCIFREPDGYVLVDYKTDRVKDINQLRDEYGEQIRLYKAAFDVLLPEKIKTGYIYSFVLGQCIEI